ncbi:hypothetical protein HDU96_007614 [Phlyctochytrium bullatum]|nr:hypothetical protein HDU96_007614 [Phlyctochytrium bullatum]
MAVTNTPRKPSPIPPELVSHIVHHMHPSTRKDLLSAMLVNSVWFDTATPKLWHTLHIEGPDAYHRLSTACWPDLVPAEPCAKPTLTSHLLSFLSFTPNKTPPPKPLATRYPTHLHTLDLSHLTLPHGFLPFLLHCPSLHRLSLTHVLLNPTPSLPANPNPLPRLTDLSLHHVPLTVPHLLPPALLTHLHTLHLAATGLTEPALCALLATVNPDLVALKLGSVDAIRVPGASTRGLATVKGEELARILARLRGLVELDLEGMLGVSPEGLGGLVGVGPEWGVPETPPIAPAAEPPIADALAEAPTMTPYRTTPLHRLVLRATSPTLPASHLHALLTHSATLVSLRSLTLSDLHTLPAPTLTAVAAHTPRLTFLELERLHVTDAALQSIARRCTSLRQLRVCGVVGWDDLRAVVGESAAKLEVVVVSGVKGVRLGEGEVGCKGVKVVQVDGCPGLGEEAMRRLVGAWEGLERLVWFGEGVGEGFRGWARERVGFCTFGP